jgi:uroporphyrinogen-III synthase
VPLTGKRILITRTRHQASDLAARLESLGATTILIPTIEIIPPATYAPLDAALAQLETYDWLLFTSVNAVEIFHHRRNPPQNRVPHPSQSHREGWGIRATREPLSSPDPQNSVVPSPDSRTSTPHTPHPRIAVIGPATARAVESIGLTADLLPPQYIAESLAAALTPHAPGANMLLIRAAEARDHLPEALTAAGATVTIAEAYRNQIPPESIPALRDLFSAPANHPDAITFTSASTARNLIALLEAADLTLPPGITLASIGPITSQTLRDLGHPSTVEAAEPTIPALIQSLLTQLSPPQ